MSRKRKRRTQRPQHRGLLALLRHDTGKPLRPIPGLIASVLLVLAWFILRYEPATPPAEADIVVYTNASCKCHRPWVHDLKRSGLAVGVVQTRDVMNVQAELGVPREFTACHTASADGYWIEGHVPATAIATLLEQRPQNVGGLAHVRAEQQIGDQLLWEVVTYSNDGQPVSSKTQAQPLDESDEQGRRYYTELSGDAVEHDPAEEH